MIPYIKITELDLGIVTLHPFGILVSLGVLVGTSLTARRARRLGLDVTQLHSFLTWMLVGGFIAGHALDSVMYHWRELAQRPWSIFFLWEGLSSFGGFIGALVGIVLWKFFERRGGWFARRARSQPILPFADLVLSVLPIGWAFGRAGCSVVHDHPGAHATAGSWLAVAYPGPGEAAGSSRWKLGFIELIHGTVPTYDLGLLELMFTVILAVCFVLTWRRRVATGTYAVVTALSYAPVRFAMDSLRAPEPVGDPRYDLLGKALRAARLRAGDGPAHYAIALTPAQWLCMVLFVFGLVMLRRLVQREHDHCDPASRLAAGAEQTQSARRTHSPTGSGSGSGTRTTHPTPKLASAGMKRAAVDASGSPMQLPASGAAPSQSTTGAASHASARSGAASSGPEG